MGKLRNYLLADPSTERDQYFIDLYVKAEKAAHEVARNKQGKGLKIVGAEDINVELKKLLAEDLDIEDFDDENNRVMYHYAHYFHLTLHKNDLPSAASDEDREEYARYQIKFAAIQQTLTNYTLGENGKAEASVALNRWYETPCGQIAQIIKFCEQYKHDLDRVVYRMEHSVFKFGLGKSFANNPTLKDAKEKLSVVKELLDFLKNDSHESTFKIIVFKEMYEGSVIYKPLQKAKSSITSILAQALPRVFTKNVEVALQELNMQISERENISGIDNIVENNDLPKL